MTKYLVSNSYIWKNISKKLQNPLNFAYFSCTSILVKHELVDHLMAAECQGNQYNCHHRRSSKHVEDSPKWMGWSNLEERWTLTRWLNENVCSDMFLRLISFTMDMSAFWVIKSHYTGCLLVGTFALLPGFTLTVLHQDYKKLAKLVK